MQITKLKPKSLHFSERLIFALDPGTVNIGLAKVYKDTATIWEIHKKRETNPIERIQNIQYLLSDLWGEVPYYQAKPLLRIEGASYRGFRQVELSQIRTSAANWGLQRGMEVEIIPPLTIRKRVFGNARIKAANVWTDLPLNAADALAIAYSVFIEVPTITMKEWESKQKT